MLCSDSFRQVFGWTWLTWRRRGVRELVQLLLRPGLIQIFTHSSSYFGNSIITELLVSHHEMLSKEFIDNGEQYLFRTMTEYLQGRTLSAKIAVRL